MSDKHTNIIETLLQDSNLRRAEPEALARLAAHATRRHYEKGEYVFKSGEDANRYQLVETGCVVLSRESPSGKVFTYRIAVRGTSMNAAACFHPRVHNFSARVAEPADILAIPSQEFRQWVLANPDVAAGIINTMGDLLDGAYTRILDLVDASVEERILNALNMLSSQIGPDLPLTNADIAELVGTSRETAARVISRLKDEGIITKARGHIRVLDKDRLDNAATSPFFLI